MPGPFLLMSKAGRFLVYEPPARLSMCDFIGCGIHLTVDGKEVEYAVGYDSENGYAYGICGRNGCFTIIYYGKIHVEWIEPRKSFAGITKAESGAKDLRHLRLKAILDG